MSNSTTVRKRFPETGACVGKCHAPHNAEMKMADNQPIPSSPRCRSGLIDTKTQTIRYELFDPSQRDLLIQSLLAPCPEIVTSARALAAQKEAEEEQRSEADLDANASEETGS